MPAEEYEILVIDNGTPRFHQFTAGHQAQNLRFICLRGNANPYTCRNRGIDESRGDILVFLDAGTIPARDWLDSGITSMTESELDIGAGEIEIDRNGSNMTNQLYSIMYLQNGKNHRYGYGFPAGNLFVRRALFDTLGRFDDEYISGGDISWTRKAMGQGYRTGFMPKAVVRYGGKTLLQFSRSVIKYGRGSANHQKKSGNFTAGSFMRSLAPMRWDRFNEAVAYRHPGGIEPGRRFLLYCGAYGVKLLYAAGFIRGLFFSNLSRQS